MYEFFKAFFITLVVIAVVTLITIAYAFPARPSTDQAASTVYIQVGANGHGSGVYIGNGRVITAAHVAKEGTEGTPLTVKLSTGEEAPATVVWMDTVKDVALLKIGNTHFIYPSNLACNLPNPVVGTQIFASGYPLSLGHIITRGRVAGEVTQDANGQIRFIADLTIAPGNSGGPVYDLQTGNIVGIAVAVPVYVFATPVGVQVALFPLAYVIPRSVICAELVNPPAPPAPVQTATN